MTNKKANHNIYSFEKSDLVWSVVLGGIMGGAIGAFYNEYGEAIFVGFFVVVLTTNITIFRAIDILHKRIQVLENAKMDQ